MNKDRQHFTERETEVSNKYMSANGIESQGETGSTGYKLFTSQYFIGIGVGMLAGYFLLPKILKK